jgi:hypothetical protein
MKNILIGLSVTFGSIPGLIIIQKGLGVPPSESESLYGGVIEATGCLSLLLIHINKYKLQTIPIKLINRIIIYTFLLFILTLLLYIFIDNYFVISYPNRTDTLFPFWNQGKLSEEINQAGSRENFLKYGSDQVKLEINKYSKASYILTKIIFIFLYQLVFTSLVVCFGFGAIRAAKIDT